MQREPSSRRATLSTSAALCSQQELWGLCAQVTGLREEGLRHHWSLGQPWLISLSVHQRAHYVWKAEFKLKPKAWKQLWPLWPSCGCWQPEKWGWCQLQRKCRLRQYRKRWQRAWLDQPGNFSAAPSLCGLSLIQDKCTCIQKNNSQERFTSREGKTKVSSCLAEMITLEREDRNRRGNRRHFTRDFFF